MRAKCVEIRWHDTRPIYSADFQQSPPSNLSTLLQKRATHPYAQTEEQKKREALAEREGKVWRLATAGGDNMIMMWLVHPNPALTQPKPPAGSAAPPTPQVVVASSAGGVAPPPAVEYLATLAKHQGVVNVVRFCPKGEMLASAGDDGNVLLWVLSTGQSTTVFGESAEDRAYEREAWRPRLMLRGPAQCEIYDVAWSPCGDFLLTGDTAKTARIWNATDGQCIKQITEHTNFVQGVAWDPLGQFIATQSSDRSMHIYTVQITKDNNGSATAEVHHVGKHSKAEVVQNPGGSWVSPLTSPSALTAPTGHSMRPPASKRSQSVTSDVSMRSESSSAIAHHQSSASAAATPSLAPTTAAMHPPPEIPHHASSSSHHHAGHSRQSSSSAQPSPSLSAHGRVARSPSPAPLPAVAIEAEHMKHSSEWRGRERGTVKLYGDEGVSAFFRRLGWSTDGGLLVSPAGRWEDPWLPPDATSGTEGGGKKEKGKGRGGDDEQPVVASATKKKRRSKPNQLSGLRGAEAGAGGEKPTVYLYGRASMAQQGGAPLAHLPGHRTSSIAIRFSPVVYKLRSGVAGAAGTGGKRKRGAAEVSLAKGKTVEVKLQGSLDDCGGLGGQLTRGTAAETSEEEPETAAVFSLGYRMVYAVATHDSVFVYDTQQSGPICIFGNLHYASFTDVAWSADGETLVLSSSDGYCSLAVFDKNELGTPISLPARAVTAPPTPAPTPLPAMAAQLPLLTTTTSQKALEPFAAPMATAAAAVAGPSVKADGDGGDAQPPKPKKRRVALTFEGPVP